MNTAIDLLEKINMLADAHDCAQRHYVTDEEVVANARRIASSCGCRFNEQSLGVLRDYLNGDSILLTGAVGVGKTFLLCCMPNLKYAMNMKIASGWKLDDLGDALVSYDETPILVDDIGVEPSEYKSFGTSSRLLEFIIAHRENAAAPTYYTTNLTSQQLLERYGERVVDRLTKCRCHRLTGESRRVPGVVTPHFISTMFRNFILGRKWEGCATRCNFYDAASHRCLKGCVSEPRPVERCPFF